MKLLQCPKVSTNEMEESKDERVLKKKRLTERDTSNIITKKAKEELIKKLLEKGSMVAQCIGQVILYRLIEKEMSYNL